MFDRVQQNDKSSHVRDIPTGNANMSGSWSDLGWLLMSVMEMYGWVIHEIRKTNHERISEVAETGAVLHFLVVDIGGDDFPCNMYNIDWFSSYVDQYSMLLYQKIFF